MNKKIPLYQPSLTQKEKNNVKSCLEDNWISSKGRFIKKFENSFKKKFNYKYSTVTTNGTTALHLFKCFFKLFSKLIEKLGLAAS